MKSTKLIAFLRRHNTYVRTNEVIFANEISNELTIIACRVEKTPPNYVRTQ